MALIDAAVERFWRETDRYEKLARFVGETCRSLLETNGIRGTVQWRAKAGDRLRAKLLKYLRSGEHAADFVDVDSTFRILKDLAGARITTYVETDRARVIDLIQERFSGFAADATIVPDVKDQPFGFYRATHCMVRVRDEEAVGSYQNLRGLACEIQVCSQLAHVFHELEHDLRYKPLSGDLSTTQNEFLNALARLMEVGDTIINQTLDASSRRLARQAELRPTNENDARLREQRLPLLSDSPLLMDLARKMRDARHDHDLPETPAAFYQEAMELIASGVLRKTASSPNTRRPELLDHLTRVAWALFSPAAGATRTSRDALLSAIQRTSRTPTVTATHRSDEFFDLGFLTTSDAEITFRDPSFHEFLAASYVASRINTDGWDAPLEAPGNNLKSTPAGALLDDQAFEPTWETLIVFVAGLLHDPAPLVELLANEQKDDFYRHRLGLLCRCYRGLDAQHRQGIASQMRPVFADVLRIAKRCEHDDTGHRKPWLEWAELLLVSPDAAAHLCEGLLALQGRYRGWAVSLKVLELLDRVLTSDTVTPSVVETFSRLAESDEDQWRINTARLALRLADSKHKQALIARFVNVLARPHTPTSTRLRLAEAVACSDNTLASQDAAETILACSQDEAIAYAERDHAVHALVSLLQTDHAPRVAPLLIDHVFNPSSQHHFWLAWRIIGKAEAAPASPWSAAFLALMLSADREHDQRLKLWAAQALSQHPDLYARALGLSALWSLVQGKASHSWVHAARWLIEHEPAQAAENARAALISEASNVESDRRREALAELLEMGAIDPLGGPIHERVRDAVVRELEEYPQKYGPRLHVSAPGGPTGNADMELFTDNPAAVIKALHTFGGPSFYVRDRDDPNDEKEKTRHWNAQLLHGTRYWPEVLRLSFQSVAEGLNTDRDGALGIVLFAGTGDDLISIISQTLQRGGSSSKRVRHDVLEELDNRGWRLRFRRRSVEILRRGSDGSRESAVKQERLPLSATNRPPVQPSP